MTIAVLDKDGSPQTISTIDELLTVMGEVQATPTSNTVLARLKAAVDLLATIDADTGALTAAADGNDKLGVVIHDTSGTGVDPVGQVAHDAADGSGTRNFPTKIGFKAVAAVSGVTAVSANDVTDGYADLDGAQIVRPYACIGDLVQEIDTITSTTQTAFGSGLAAPGSGLQLAITSVTITNTSATDTTVALHAGAAGAELWRFSVPADGGVTHSFSTPLLVGDNTALAYKCEDAATTIYVAAAGFKTTIT